MHKEKIPTTEKEPVLEELKKYLEEEREAYSSKNRKRYIDGTLRFAAIERWKKVAGYEDREGNRIPGLIEKLAGKDKEKACEEGLSYIEEVLGGGSAESGTQSLLDLINRKEYNYNIPRQDRNKNIESPEYRNRKIELRKLADALAGEIYKKRSSELNEYPRALEQENLLSHVATKTSKSFSQVENELKKGDFRDIFELIDEKIYKNHRDLKSCDKKEDKDKVKTCQENLFKLRRHRRFFLNLKEG